MERLASSKEKETANVTQYNLGASFLLRYEGKRENWGRTNSN